MDGSSVALFVCWALIKTVYKRTEWRLLSTLCSGVSEGLTLRVLPLSTPFQQKPPPAKATPTTLKKKKSSFVSFLSARWVISETGL